MPAPSVAVLLVVSLLLQLSALGVCARLIGISGRRLPWFLLATGIALMAAGRGINLYRLLDAGTLPDLAAEWTALVIAALFLAGLLRSIPAILANQRAREQLHESHLVFETAQEVADLGSWISDPRQEGRLVWSKQVYRIFGLPEGSFDGRVETFFAHVHPGDVEAVRRASQEAIAGEQPYRIDHRIVRQDGSVRWVHERAVVLRDASGNPFRMVGICQDITERKQAEEALRVSEARYRTLVEHAPEAIVVFDVDRMNFDDANSEAEQLFALSRAELLEQNPVALSPAVQPDGRPSAQAARELIQRALDGETPIFEWTHRNAQGREIPCEVRLVRLPALGKTLVRGSITDISERKRSESKLRQAQAKLAQAQKMEAIGRLAGGVAHDFNNLLTVIGGYAEILLAEAQADSSARGRLQEIRDAARRATALTRQLLAFSRKQVAEPRVVAVNGVVSGLEKLLRRLIGEDIALVSKLAGDAGNVRADAGQIEQILMNLAVNARDAMPDGGTLRIETAGVEIEDAASAPVAGMRPGRYVLLEVSDTGAGMTRETMAHIFEPFFTTKDPGKGTGLGLAMVYGFVEQIGGQILVESEPQRGTRFRIYLPSVAEPVSVAAAESEARELPALAARRVLLAEDDVLVRRLIYTVLAEHGFEVLEASDPKDALALATLAPAVDLLVTDVVMPGMGGQQLANRVQALHPDVRVLYVSGYTDDRALERSQGGEGAQFLPKPFTPAALIERVSAILERKRDRVDG